ncbi:DUF6789 family protein [Halobacterium yunchengense]|uniref:DUF6789 family protein n=1 Tax=Halobacterium yunchengense TaxID=3108497 RepID=UPI00300876FC
MAERTSEATAEEQVLGKTEEPLTVRAVLGAFAGGIAGLLVMAPVIAGIPILLGVFEMEPLERFADLVIADASGTLGVAFFVAGGAFVLPLFFLVTATFLPPREPKYVRGATIATLFWAAFVFIFWPNGGLFVDGVFLAVTLVAHWLYGLVLGLVMQRLTGIPEHRV